jgi:hypothetical protein
MWDATQPDKPAQFGISSATPTKCTVTERQDLKVMPDSMASAAAGCLTCNRSRAARSSMSRSRTLILHGHQGQANYSNLWVVQPGDWDVVNGQVVLDRSDPLALSRLYQNRVGPNVGSMRWVDSTVTGGNPQSCPYPEFLPTVTDESGGTSRFTGNSGVTRLSGRLISRPHRSFTVRFSGSRASNSRPLLEPTLQPHRLPAPLKRTRFQMPTQLRLWLGLRLRLTPRSCVSYVRAETVTIVPRQQRHHADDARCRAGSGQRAQIDPRCAQRGRGDASGLDRPTHHGHPARANDRQRDRLRWRGLAARAIHGRVIVELAGVCSLSLRDGTDDVLFCHRCRDSLGRRAEANLSARSQGPDMGLPQNGMIPIEAAAIATGKFSKADFHVNVPIDACDDMVYEIAKRVLANFPAGRRVYVEYGNEPWNWAFTSFYYHSGIMGPLSVPGNPYQLAHYAQRSGQVHGIFRQVFGAAGRAGEIQGLINCQMGSGDSQVRPHLEYGQRMGTPFDAVAVGPYWSFEATPLNQKVVAALDDEQFIDVIMADQRTNPRTNNAWMNSVTNALYGFNQKYQTNVKLIGYEGGIETAHPWGAARNHDLQYNPNWYFAETDWIAWCQTWGLDRLHVYSLAQWWNPESWGGYHTSQQRHSRGDGLNGAVDNRLWRRGVRAVGVNQDSRVDSIRGQAWLDWLGTLQP